MLTPLDADVERAVTLLFVEDKPLDVEVEREATLLVLVDSPVDRDPTPL